MYLLRNVDSRTNPIPSDFGKPAEDYFFQTEKAARGDKFKKIFNVK
jgi:hypothetical protein